MTHIAIEISDVGLEAGSESGVLGSPSPGYVLLDRRHLVAGEAARSEARLRPRFVSHRHWDLMSLQPVGRPFPSGLSQADLVHTHLVQYWASLLETLGTTTDRASVLFAVPAVYSVDQLGLLLGVARAADVPVVGLVDSALAAMAGAEIDEVEIDEGALHLDIRLHRAVWTLIEAGGGVSGTGVSRSGVKSVEAGGLHSIRKAWVRLIAQHFVREARYDPLRGGTSEQALYNQLDSWAGEIERVGTATISMGAGGRARTIEVSSAALAAAASRELDAVVESAERLLGDRALPIYLSSRVAGVPGLTRRLAELSGSDPVQLGPGAAVSGALQRRDSIEAPGTELPMIIELPLLDPPTAKDPTDKAPAVGPPVS